MVEVREESDQLFQRESFEAVAQNVGHARLIDSAGIGRKVLVVAADECADFSCDLALQGKDRVEAVHAASMHPLRRDASSKHCGGDQFAAAGVLLCESS